MRFILCQLRKVLRAVDGNATLGFAMVAPLVVAVFIAVLQLVAITREQAALAAIAHDASRVASVFNGTPSHGVSAARAKLGSSTVTRARATIKIQRVTNGGVHYVQTTISENYRIAWLAKSVMLNASVRSIDEGAL